MTKTKEQITSDNNGFAFPLQPSTDLGLAMLIAESEDGQHEPVAVVGTISEARDFADSDFRDRMRRLEQGEDAVLCPVPCTKSGLAEPMAATGLRTR
jgi:hypothetical protein